MSEKPKGMTMRATIMDHTSINRLLALVLTTTKTTSKPTLTNQVLLTDQLEMMIPIKGKSSSSKTPKEMLSEATTLRVYSSRHSKRKNNNQNQSGKHNENQILSNVQRQNNGDAVQAVGSTTWVDSPHTCVPISILRRP